MNRYFATFDDKGNITGHYLEGISNFIPTSVLPLTEEQWKQSCDGNLVRDITNNEWIERPKPSDEEVLLISKNDRKSQINITRDIKINEGVQYQGFIFDSDDTARQNINDVMVLINSGMELPSDFTWRTKDNIDVPASSDFVVGLMTTMNQHKYNCYKKSWDLKKNIDNCTSIEQVKDIKWI